MESTDEAVPSALEIQKQLERLLRSDAFRNAESQSKTLALIVKSFLNNEEITQKDIVSLLFPFGHADPKTGIARATVFNLRSTLDEYYKAEGKNDRVIIGIKVGRYRPTFSYNSNYRVFEYYLAGKRLANSMQNVEDIVTAYRCFYRAVEADPSFALAYAEKANISLIEAMFRSGQNPQGLIAEAEADAKKALSLDARIWQAWLVLGIIHCSRFAWASAEQDFSNAIKIAPLEASESFYYGAYLMAVGRVEEALKLSERRYERSSNDVFPVLNFGMMLWVSRDRVYGTSRNVAQAAVERNLTLAFSYALCGCVFYSITLAAGVFPRYGVSYMEQFEKYFHTDDFFGFSLLCSSLGASRSLNKLARKELRHDVEMKYESFIRKSQREYVSPFQLALAHMAMSNFSDAVAALNTACDHGDPKVMWLHIWPILDTIKDREDFKRLVHRMNLPAAGQRLLSKRSTR